jgi:hypothetical protein
MPLDGQPDNVALTETASSPPSAAPRAPSTASGTAGWTPDVEELLKDWRNRVYAAQASHYALADRFRILNYLVGIPAVVFSSVVGTALFAGLEKDSPRTFFIASVSIVSAVLAALQTFLRFAERVSQHATAGDWYSAIRRDIEQLIHMRPDDRGIPKACLDEIRQAMNQAGQNSPELSNREWTRQARRFGVREPQIRL